MQVKKTDIAPTKLKLIITLGTSDISPIHKRVVERLGKDTKIAGFRPGKAPLNVMEKHLDQDVLQTEVLEESVNQAYSDTLNAQDIRPAAQPEVAIKKYVPFTDIEVEIEVEVIGKITLPDYKKIRKAMPSVNVTTDDIKEVLESISKQMAEKTDVDRAAKDGDEVYLDFKGTDPNGDAIQGAEGSNYPLVLGSKAFIPGFEENLIGMKPGDHKDFTLTFPKDYGVAALANKKVTFAVDIIKISESKPVKIDDEMAKKVGSSFSSLKDLKADIKTQLTQDRQNQARTDYDNELVADITKKSKVEVPESMIEDQLAQAEQEERQNLTYRGETWEEHLKSEGVTEQEHRDKNRPVAADRVKAGLVLSQIAEDENLQVTPEELEIRIQLLKGQYQDQAMQAELDDPNNRRTVAMRILTEKTLDRLHEYVEKKAPAKK